MKEIICGIYKITNLTNNKVYIGQSVDILNKRWPLHVCLLNNGTHDNIHLQNAWNKYGENNFEFSIIIRCEQIELNDYEKHYISLYKSYNPEFGYNLTLGGEGCIPTEETKKKMSEAHIGLLGTAESKRKQSEKLSGKNNPMYGRRGSLSPVYGKPKSKETIQKLRDSWDIERKSKQSARISGKNNPMSGKTGDSNPASKKVMCVETGDVFDTMKEAAKWCGLKTHTNISNACNGKRKHAGLHPQTGEKLTWEYVE